MRSLDVIIYNLVFMPRTSRGGLMFNGRPTVPFLWKWYIQNASRELLSDLAQTTSSIGLKGDIIRNLVHIRSLWPHKTKWHKCRGGQTDEVMTRCTQKVEGHLRCDVMKLFRNTEKKTLIVKNVRAGWTVMYIQGQLLYIMFILILIFLKLFFSLLLPIPLYYCPYFFTANSGDATYFPLYCCVTWQFLPRGIN